MTVHDAIFSRLSTDTTLMGLVSTRIFPDTAPQDQTKPFIVFRVADTAPATVKDGAAQNNLYQIEINAYAFSFTDVQSIHSAIKSRLDKFTGTSGGVSIRLINVDSRGSIPFNPDNGIFGAALLARVFTLNT